MTETLGFPTEIQVDKNFVEEVLNDYRICCISRETSIVCRKEVLSGKGKFGITGDGKEVPQIAMARAFKKGDFYAGYYRDQTFMFALGITTVEDYFAQLYADPENDPFSKGRNMNAHFATRLMQEDGNWLPHKDLYNITGGTAPTAGQMARAFGLAAASKKYRALESLHDTQFSNYGNEVCFCTIGDASTSEGAFWEVMNAAGTVQIPLATSVWDDGYGISVPVEVQTTKSSISDAMAGLQKEKGTNGIDIETGYAWDYPGLCEMYEKGINKVRTTHTTTLFHIKECTQPQGHSTSGSHERYKSKERLEWEKEMDCIKVMGEWIIKNRLATEETLEEIRKEAKSHVIEGKNKAWKKFSATLKGTLQHINSIYTQLLTQTKHHSDVVEFQKQLNRYINPTRREYIENVKGCLRRLGNEKTNAQTDLENWLKATYQTADEHYHTHLYSESPKAANKITAIPAIYSDDSPVMNGYQIINTFFDQKLEEIPELMAFGEDVGHIGDVNQGFAGLQEKYGKERVYDTGIRETTIIGQGMGMAMRGLRPIAEIQYLDYLIYAITVLSDDIATLRYRTKGLQQSPIIIRTRGHRLEGIWHTGSPISMMLGSLRGICVLVPRNFVQAAGLYNTMLQADDPCVVVEPLNGYRLKETLPDNLNEFRVPIGIPEILQSGTDVTLVTYGSCVRVAQAGIKQLEAFGISVELIDAQTLLPFDTNHLILESLKKTNRIVFMDEDFPGGTTAYMMQEVLDKQGGYKYLDSQPKALSAAPHRSPYGSDGDYFSKPNAEDVFEVIYGLMREADPQKYNELYFLR